MIWWNLALFAVSFVLTALFAPKPEIEDARPDDLDPNAFPQASENAPAALGLGCVRLRAPNTMWYGDFNPVPIKEKVKTGLFSSKTVIVAYNNFLSLDMGLIMGPNVRLKAQFIDGEQVEGGSGSYEEQVEGQFFDDSIPGTTGANITYESANLTTELGLTGNEIDQLCNAGNLRISGTFTASVTFTAGGGDMANTQAFDVRFWDDLNGTGNELFPDPTTATSLGGTTPGTFTLAFEDIVVPVGTRSIDYGTQILPLFPLNATISGVTNNVHVVAIGVVVDEFSANIFEPELFGGRKSGGGWVGDYNFYDGAFDQSVDPGLEASLGLGMVPAYNGMSHVVYKDNNIGETANLRKIEYLLARYEDPLGTGFVMDENGDHELMNALYFILTDEWAGLGIDPARFVTQSFIDAQTVLVSEGNYGSILVTALKNGKSVINEILRQVDGAFQQNSDGTISMVLIRDDYDEGTLDIYDESDVVETQNLKRGSWDDVKSEVKTIYKSRDSESNKIALARDEAIESQNGRKVSEVSFPLCYNATLANHLGWRELSQLSVPLLSATLIMKRSAYQLKMGNVFKLSFPEYGLSELIVRVQKVDLGTRDDNRIRVEVIQDRFAATTALIADPASTGWQDLRPEPLSIATSEIVEMPRFLQRKVDEPIEDGFGSVIPFPLRPQSQSSDFTFNQGIDVSNLDVFDPLQVEYPYTGLLSSALSKSAGFETGIAPSINLNTVVGGNDNIIPAATVTDIQEGVGGLLYANGEWMAYTTATDNTGGEWTLGTIYRGLLGTTPKEHPVGTRFWVFDPVLAGEGDIGGELLEDGTVSYKILDRVGGTSRSPLSETATQFVLQDIADRPIRPRNLQADASRVLPVDPSGNITFTWSPANREVDNIEFETDVTSSPDQTETYDIEVWIDGVQDVGRSTTGVSSGHIIDFTGATGISGEVRVYSRRTVGDLKTSVGYACFPLTFSFQADTTQFTADTTTITADKT